MNSIKLSPRTLLGTRFVDGTRKSETSEVSRVVTKACFTWMVNAFDELPEDPKEKI